MNYDYSNFEEELEELRLDIAIADTFGMDKLRCVTWAASVPTVDDLPFQPEPDTCCYVEDEESAYLFDGCGWVMFMSPEISAKILAEDTALLESISIQGTLKNGGALYYRPPVRRQSCHPGPEQFPSTRTCGRMEV